MLNTTIFGETTSLLRHTSPFWLTKQLETWNLLNCLARWQNIVLQVVEQRRRDRLCVIDETLRLLYPPLWLMVPVGTEIYISLYLIQRSPHLVGNS